MEAAGRALGYQARLEDMGLKLLPCPTYAIYLLLRAALLKDGAKEGQSLPPPTWRPIQAHAGPDGRDDRETKAGASCQAHGYELSHAPLQPSNEVSF